MKKVIVYHYDAFAVTPNKGNPAGVVIKADDLSDNQMQEIAYKIGFNETAFITESSNAEIQIKYFTPMHEMSLCGHGTIAALYCMVSRGLIDGKKKINIETKAGILQVDFFEKDNRLNILMNQTEPVFRDYQGSLSELADVIGLSEVDIDVSMPIVYGSTGTWTLLVPIKTLKAFSYMEPKNKMFPDVLKEMPRCSIHPFCMETAKKDTHMHARHFSSPFSGTVEDPVTGTASGVMGGYYLTYIAPYLNEAELIIEQGREIGREGEVCVFARRQNSNIKIAISGTATYNSDKVILID